MTKKACISTRLFSLQKTEQGSVEWQYLGNLATYDKGLVR